jgi:hypothetical protein
MREIMTAFLDADESYPAKTVETKLLNQSVFCSEIPEAVRTPSPLFLMPTTLLETNAIGTRHLAHAGYTVKSHTARFIYQFLQLTTDNHHIERIQDFTPLGGVGKGIDLTWDQ